MRSTRAPHIAIVAGEASGDALGAGLVNALKKRWPQARFSGVAGPLMREQGVEALERTESLSVMGLAEVVLHLPRLLALRARLMRRLSEARPDILVGIDSPDFNLRLETVMRRRGMRTVHYVSPSVWAWRPGRVRTVARAAETLLSLLPFEAGFYADTDVTVSYVGHPLADEIPMETDAAACRAALDLPPQAPIVALLPGSRVSEVSRLAAPFLRTAGWLAQRIPDLQCVVPLASEAAASAFERVLQQEGPAANVRTVNGHARDVMGASDAVLSASGTATLEAMLLKRPMVVAYRVSGLTAWLLGTMGLLKAEYVSLPNLLAGKGLVEECLQKRAEVDILGPAMLRVLTQPAVRREQIESFSAMHELLRRGADDRAADAIGEMLGSL